MVDLFSGVYELSGEALPAGGAPSRFDAAGAAVPSGPSSDAGDRAAAAGAAVPAPSRIPSLKGRDRVNPKQDIAEDAGWKLPAELVVAVEGYLDLARPVLGLQDWQVRVSDVPAADDAVAQIDAPWAQRRAEVRLGAEFLRASAEDRRDALVHELVHLILMPSWQLVEEMFDQELSSRASRVGWLAFTQQMEYAVDQLASVLSQLLPVPQLPDVEVVIPGDSDESPGSAV